MRINEQGKVHFDKVRMRSMLFHVLSDAYKYTIRKNLLCEKEKFLRLDNVVVEESSTKSQ